MIVALQFGAVKIQDKVYDACNFWKFSCYYYDVSVEVKE
jgi:hypothetical protein